jgi:hypothetical protein
LKTYIPITCKNLEKMDKFLDTYDLQKLNQKDTKILDRSIIGNGIEVVIKTPNQEKSRAGQIHC